ncbi:wyosine biosynthesis protein TYW1 [Candidatus Methanoperedens nitroreducens]|uniref:S-adenosyl-L-methionine-dependent tRNA 4-demethylwyosine synthase n=1 Tax=Candidatus Methanoperedens nitratireducens TaxID=1392998 RepID=A0A062V782_9EURY|nr:4-demethylwyosine synthase TYW1 [Candidatus Methanoperedens nitroreducens]KCZ72408.1 wyosine biosynthesis protein TYW1 [Candidatus Methanoperedens nitroreducens]MDJ1423658.1 4-demethylwyosine synthase TYW1 [Candidatus Methanoperedens sp.]
MTLRYESTRELLKKHGYHLAGTHSAVKTCLWLNKSLRNEGSCYKSRFYGIASHRCIQMTPTLLCNHRCLHCWRAIEVQAEAPESWDSPEDIVDSILIEQRRLVSGYGGSEIMDKAKWKEAFAPKHVAISLSGEPTLYPYLPGLIDEFHKKEMTTFVVTNGTNPEVIGDIRPTQLYISLNAPDKEIYKRACGPLDDTWERINQSLEVMRDSRARTAIRITLIRGVNMVDPDGFAHLIETAEPDYVELKAYMHLGFSRKRLSLDSMPSHQEVMDFSQKVAEALDYRITDDSEASRVVLLSLNPECYDK